MTKPERQSRSFLIVATVLGIATILSGCRTGGYRDPISKFQSAASVVIASTRLYATELNKVERDHYIAGKLSQKAEIKLNELEGAQVFSQEGLKARLDAMDQLASYGSLLSKLANSDAPSRISAEIQSLGDAIKRLSTTVNDLANTDDAAFRSAVGPVSVIVGEILSLITQNKIREALDKAIKDGEVPINKLLSVIRNDISIAYERKRNSLSDTRVSLVREYENERAKGPTSEPEKLRLYADRIRAHEDRWEAFASADPGEGLDAMAKAHTALVNFAKSSQKVNDLASLVEAMEAFAARAMNIGRAIQALRGNSY
jgi:outer membrane murein-binding lipoprotein Lpp